MLYIVYREFSAEESPEMTASLTFKTPDRLLFNLTDTFTGQIEFKSYFFKCHFLATDPEEHLENVTFSGTELAKSAIDLH